MMSNTDVTPVILSKDSRDVLKNSTRRIRKTPDRLGEWQCDDGKRNHEVY